METADQLLEITDTVLRLSLWTFLTALLVTSLFIARSLRSRERKLFDYYEEEIEARLADDSGTLEPRRARFSELVDQPRMAFNATLLSALIAVLCFFALGFAPIPTLQNFTHLRPWHFKPLRLTSLSPERFHEGFSLQGEVWNQTQDRELEGVVAVVRIRGRDAEVLDELEAAVDPTRLAPGTAGNFSLRYTKNSPFILGYEVSFKSGDERPLPHVEGFGEN